MDDVPKRYDISKDEMLPVTQEWVTTVEAQFAVFGAARRAARSVIEIRDGLLTCSPPELQAFLDAWKPEFAQNIEKYIKERDDALQVTRTEENHGRDFARLETPEGLPSGQDSAESCEGVQQGRPKSEAPGAQGQVAAAYAVTVDGWIAIKHRAIRNPRAPSIVWMEETVWQKLAVCATTQGQFYIPCTPSVDSPESLRRLIKEQEPAA